ncbi:hypothetical protein EV385_5095 [Krasilnikovia cinnamomea]|uniref:Uncharacterized protein n=1 Tax=Krasilnikovia cinnamomea TaxID=349313 RepID=A0A4Q7ZR03_9ACTN|nr:hypothetical protein [Krasilnikovia cinnamomea]RZU53201.1 hypothetical protein EV385_5095 [Krasilnikovia cinnamomea]
MTEPSGEPDDTGSEPARPVSGHRTPRWVIVSAIAAAAVVLIVVIVHLAGGGFGSLHGAG